ncbi:hypothetical protein DMC47_10400 [Nostoc sp. 3335mG]|nr:hypothetical protein DMC47_10400 [Nostoc sp. 3335mG]
MVLDQLARLQAATGCILEGQHAGDAPEAVIQRLLAEHGAIRRCSPSDNSLRVAGVVARCAWSRDEGLLNGWRRLAARKILQLQGKEA